LVIEVGETVTGALPEPVRLTVSVLPPWASSTMLSVAVRVPVPLGVMVTDIWQLEVPGTVAGAAGQEFVSPKSLLFGPVIVTEEIFSGKICSLVTVMV
jgi:hypothetical protein